MKLFMFYVGGGYLNSNVELHDVRFSIGENVEACYEDLRKQWWGTPDSLHLDCWGAVEQADGFDVEVTTDAEDSEGNRLFFANMGGYDPSQFAELHRNLLLVATTPEEAKERALSLVEDWTLPHKDNLFEVENLIDLSAATTDYGHRLRLVEASVEKPFVFGCDFLPIAAEGSGPERPPMSVR